MKVQEDELTIGVAERRQFQEYIALSASVAPLHTIYLDAVTGGIVQRIVAKAGSLVQRGDTILVLSNLSLLLDVTSRGAQLLEQGNNLRNTRLDMEQRGLDLGSTLLKTEQERNAAWRQAERSEHLFAKGLISGEAHASDSENVASLDAQLQLARLAVQRDSAFRSVQTELLDNSLAAIEQNLELVRQNLDQLVVRAPSSGRLTSLLVEVGQSVSPGTRIGQIDDLAGYKIEADVDEYYLPQVRVGQLGTAISDRDSVPVVVSMVYPEIVDRRFKTDLSLPEGNVPDLKLGQTVRVRLDLADPTQSLVLPRGAFMQSTGGAWAYVLEHSGEFAQRRSIRVGRQNPEQLEIVSGLSPGQRVVVSSYETFRSAERLHLID